MEDETAHAGTTPAREVTALPMRERGAALWRLMRDDDATGVSGTGHVADVVLWQDGKAAVHWRTATTSTAIYDSFDDLLKIHGHGGRTRLVPYESSFENAKRCAEMDAMENAPFASIGGVESRTAPTRPRWVSADDFAEWLVGYEFACRQMYGDDWRTCAFGWSAALEIGS